MLWALDLFWVVGVVPSAMILDACRKFFGFSNEDMARSTNVMFGYCLILNMSNSMSFFYCVYLFSWKVVHEGDFYNHAVQSLCRHGKGGCKASFLSNVSFLKHVSMG